MNLLAELQRRNVIRVAIAYVAGAWLLIQVAETVFPVYGLSDGAIQWVINLLAAGFFPVLVAAWLFELTPQGLRLDSAVAADAASRVRAHKVLDRVIMVMLGLAVSYFAFDKFVLDPAEDVEIAERARSEALIESYGDKSIAVLPFVNMSPDPEQAYFADGISEELLNLLARIPQLRVISRSSAFSFRGDDINIPQVAETLKVSHVLEGSVRKSGDRIRITAQLIEARTDTHLWSETYDRELGDIFAIQDDIATLVVGELENRLVDRLPASRRTDPEAYALFLKARGLVHGLGALPDDGREQAVPLLRRVIELDPDYAPAYTLLALAIFFFETGGEDAKYSKDEGNRIFQELLHQAIALDPDDATANVYLGTDRFVRVGWSLDDVRLVEKGIRIDPNNVEAVRVAGAFARVIGHFDAAALLGRRAVELDPLCSICYWNLTQALMFGGRLEEAEANARRRTEIFEWGWTHLGHTLLLQGKYEAALEAVDRILDYKDTIGEERAVAEHGFQSAFALYSLGRVEDLQRVMVEYVEPRAEIDPHGVAQLRAWVGDVEGAFELLDRNLDVDDPEFRWEWLRGTAWHPFFRSLHDDLRWQAYWAVAETTREELQAMEFNVDLPAFR